MGGALSESTRRLAWVAFAALIVLSPLQAHIDLVARPIGTLYRVYTDVQLFWSDIAAIAVLVLWLCSLALRPRAISWGPRFVAWPVAALLAAAFLGAPFAVDPPLALMTAIRFGVLAALALYVVNEVRDVQRVVAPLAVMLLLQAAVGIGQVVAQRSVGLGRVGEHTLAPSLPVSVVTAADGTRLLRAYGLTDHPNILGGLLAAGVLICGGLAVVRLRTVSPLALVATLAASVALLVTFSRGAWAGFFVGVVVVGAMLVHARDRRVLRRAAVVALAGLIVAAPSVIPFREALAARTDATQHRIATEVRSLDERGVLAQATTTIIAAHPLLGVGGGGLPEAMRLAQPAFRYPYEPSSVVLLDATAETGVVGGGAYLVLLLVPWLALWYRRARWTPQLAVMSGALAALTVGGFADYYTWTYSAGRIWWWLVLGLWVVAYRGAVRGDARAA